MGFYQSPKLGQIKNPFDIIRHMTENICRDRYPTKEKPDNLKTGETVWIPTGINQQGNFYTQTRDNWISYRNKMTYDYRLFRDEFSSKIDPLTGIFPRKKDETRILEGWAREDFFGPNRVIVDLGSGQAIALLEYSQEFPQTIFIGIDSNYQLSNHANLKQPGVQLIKDDWNSLDTIPSNSVDTFLSVQGGITWSCEGPKFDRTGSPETFIKAITRVAKKGCVFLPDSLYSADVAPYSLTGIINFQEKKVLQQFKQSGWDRIILNQTAFFVLT